jgi:asparagine synthase (glutamine-hydrolysing)
MNKKSNFLISIKAKTEELHAAKYRSLPNQYNIIINDLSISINYSDNAFFIKSNDENVIILMAGNIYQNDLPEYLSAEKYLLDKYLKFKKDFVKCLNGSFCLFFAQKDIGEVYFATDRFNTRKIFKFDKVNKLIVGTNINDLPLQDCKLSYAGAASYILNGAMFNDLTVFEEIKKLERSSLHKIVNFNIKSEKYWDYSFTNEYENKPISELTEELHHLYLQSIKKIIVNKQNIFISLSGGYDSRGIAAMLNNILDKDINVICFSHNFGNNIKDTDAGIARQTAEMLGYTFKLLNSYNGAPFHTLKNNAILGNGIARFCIEIDAWEQINKDFEESENSILLTGDMYDGTYEAFHGNVKRALEKVFIYEPAFLKVYKNYIKDDFYGELYKNWEYEYNKIVDSLSSYDNIVNLHDYLYMDQVIPNIYGNARECFQYPFIETAAPFYDNDIIDFIQKITPELRDRKKLHKIILESKYPEIFNIQFPTGGWGNGPDWINEIRNFSDEFINNINNHKSKLDDLISPKAIIDSILLLNEKEFNKYKGITFLKTLHNNLKRFFPSYHKIIEMLPGGDEITRKAGKYIYPRISHPLIKILILRLYLSRI